MTNPVTAIENALRKLFSFFKSDAFQSVMHQAAELAVEAAPIVNEINALIPGKTEAEIVAAYNHYGVPLAQTELSNPTLAGNALLNLATTVLQKNLPTDKATASVSLLNTAVQLAVTAATAGAIPTAGNGAGPTPTPAAA